MDDIVKYIEGAQSLKKKKAASEEEDVQKKKKRRRNKRRKKTEQSPEDEVESATYEAERILDMQVGREEEPYSKCITKFTEEEFALLVY